MNFKNKATTESCNEWVKYPFENTHPLRDERLYAFVYCLCENEDKVEEENFQSLLTDAECKRTSKEINDAFKKYEIIYDFYQYLKKVGVSRKSCKE
jgi:hypothetical protein